jgi:hypothetical protein
MQTMSALENVYKLVVKDWEPNVQPTELKYRDSLAAFLRERLKDAKVETEYRHYGTTTDVYIKQSGFFGSSEVFVELKRDLKLKSHLDRLVGQIQCLQPKKNAVIVVLCGETSPALVTRFQEVFAEELLTLFKDVPSRMALVVKDASEGLPRATR